MIFGTFSKLFKRLKRRKNTQRNCTKKKKNPNYPGNHDGVIIHLEADILEGEVKCKASGDDKIPAELFQILKDDAVKVLHSIWASKFGKLSSGHRTGKGQFSFQSQRRAVPKNVQTTTQLHSFHMLAK